VISELDHGRVFDKHALDAQIKEAARRPAGLAARKARGEVPQCGVVFTDRHIDEPARCGNFVFNIGNVPAQISKVSWCLQLRIGEGRALVHSERPRDHSTTPSLAPNLE
jgi:hypothetical protein